jgi:ribosomal protein S18 acetylase RimI-like enzyme
MLRPASIDDLKLVASWIASARDCERWAGWRVRFPVELDALPEAIQFTDTNAFSLSEQGGVVAFGQLVAKTSNRGHLARVIVAPTFRGKGFGLTLVQSLVDKARDVGFARVSLNVDRTNVPAMVLYVRLGFRDAVPPADEPPSPGSRYMEL